MTELGGVESAEDMSHIGHVVVLTPTWDNPGDKIIRYFRESERSGIFICHRHLTYILFLKFLRILPRFTVALGSGDNKRE